MTIVHRSVEGNAQGYREVSVVYRSARAAALEARSVHAQTDRIHCPVLDASRSELAYGRKALPATDRDSLKRWSKALGIDPGPVKLIAYLSGAWYTGLYNLARGEFDEGAVNTGTVKRLKRGVNTCILSTGHFVQEAFDRYVWSAQPALRGTPIDNAFLHSAAAASLYIEEGSLDAIMKHNVANAPSRRVGLGSVLSKFEMERLLLGVLGQRVALDASHPDEKTRALSVRDVHDLYKYGVFPSPVEERLEAAGLLDIPSSIEVR